MAMGAYKVHIDANSRDFKPWHKMNVNLDIQHSLEEAWPFMAMVICKPRCEFQGFRPLPKNGSMQYQQCPKQQ